MPFFALIFDIAKVTVAKVFAQMMIAKYESLLGFVNTIWHDTFHIKAINSREDDSHCQKATKALSSFSSVNV